MAEAIPEPTNRPRHGAELQPRGYVLSVNFHPHIRLSRKDGFDFASKLSDYIDPQTANLEAHQWTYSQPLGTSAAGGLEVTITPSSIQFDISFPTHRKEWLEQRCTMVLQEFYDKFDPKLVLSSSAKVVGTIEIDGDARGFLAHHVVNLNPKRLLLLKRPVHALGIRIFSPPFEHVEKRGKKNVTHTIPWVVDVKAESLIEDPSKLYLEADAQWPTPTQWTGVPKIIEELIGHLKTVTEYLEKDVINFLKAPDEDSGDPI